MTDPLAPERDYTDGEGGRLYRVTVDDRTLIVLARTVREAAYGVACDFCDSGTVVARRVGNPLDRAMIGRSPRGR